MALDLSALDEDSSPSTVVASANPWPGAIAHAPLDAFEEDPDNPRFESNPVVFDSLVADVKQHGILQPLVVRREVDGKLRIRFGSQRFRAARRAALTDVPYVVTEDPRQFDDYAQVAENERRSPLQPLELATFIAKKLAQGETKRAVARRLHLDPSAVTHLLALVGDVPRFVLELYHAGKCRTPQYLYELRRLSTGRLDEVARCCAEAVDIDRRFLMSLAEKKWKSSTASPVDGNSRGVRGVSSVLGSAITEPASAEPGRVARAAAAPEPAAAGVDGRTHGRLEQPCLLACYGKEQVRVLFYLRPSSLDRIVIQRCDGDAEEVAIADVRLLRICEWAELDKA